MNEIVIIAENMEHSCWSEMSHDRESNNLISDNIDGLDIWSNDGRDVRDGSDDGSVDTSCVFSVILAFVAVVGGIGIILDILMGRLKTESTRLGLLGTVCSGMILKRFLQSEQVGATHQSV